MRTSMDTLRAVKQAAGCTLNDLVLAGVSGGVGRFFQRRGFPMDGVEFRAAIPVSTRPASQRGETGNQVGACLATLPLAEADPVERVRQVHQMMAKIKASQQSAGAELLAGAAELASFTMMTAAARLVGGRARPYNLIVTNVPGPPETLYLLDAPMRAAYPFVPLFEHQALGIALLSYAGQLSWGLAGDWDLLPDLVELKDDLQASLAEVLAAPARPLEVGTEAPAPKPRRRRREPPAFMASALLPQTTPA
jgi:WS/DGAT/MGAT family acyltransferase